jgi:hypothetical protein
MGGFVRDTTTRDVLHLWNRRFRNDGSLQEMVEIQKEFEVFSSKHSLRQTFRLLHIVPSEVDERRGWSVFLDRLRSYASDQKGVNGHDRIVKAYKQNLESRAPLPVYATTHRHADDKRLTVTHGRPIAYEDQDYIVISIPTKPRTKTGRAAAKKRSRR